MVAAGLELVRELTNEDDDHNLIQLSLGQNIQVEYRKKVDQGMFNRQTVPPPVLPSKTKKFAIGGSRPPSAFKMS